MPLDGLLVASARRPRAQSPPPERLFSRLLARDLSGSEKLAGLAQTFQVLGTAIAAWLLARLMNARGRGPKHA